MSFGSNNSSSSGSDRSAEACFNKSLSLLNRRVHSVVEMERKLSQRNFPAAIIRQTIAELQRLALLDDLQFASLFIREKLITGSSRPLGRRRILQDMRRRGIAEEIAVQAWDQVQQEESPQSEEERAGEAAFMKMRMIRDRSDPRKVQGKLWRHLVSRGFSGEAIAQAVSRAMAGSED